ncbi:MAG: aldo/keto reductase [Oscillospiraceae bacterium]|nr:aldo/keto reductase [Oscillospiraceae bacterium]
MLYRKFGNTGVDISVLGFGAMRLPSVHKDGKNVFDYEESARMMLRAYELGVNYFDTAPLYCDCESETIVGRALKSIRDKVYVSTKYSVRSALGSDFRQGLEASLKKLDMEYIDFYHLWGINWETYENRLTAPGGPLEEARKAKEEGLIRHISFSFHDKAENMGRLAETGQFETVLAQYNLLDRSHEEGFARAHARGLGTVVMGPVGGGRLGVPSEKIRSLIPGGARSNPELALRFVLSNPHVSCALSGMSTMEQVEENCRVADRGDALSAEELEAVNAAVRENKKLADLYCTGCKYCMPCPQEVNIAVCFQLMNYHRVYEITDYARAEYKNIGMPWMAGKNASFCNECGVCETKCPQKLAIRDQLRETDKVLGGG